MPKNTKQLSIEEVMEDVAGSLALSIAQKAVDVLNAALRADPKTVQALVENRIKSNIDPNSDSPAVYSVSREELSLGMLGVINGIIQAQSSETICAVYNEDSTLNSFCLKRDLKK